MEGRDYGAVDAEEIGVELIRQPGLEEDGRLAGEGRHLGEGGKSVGREEG